MRELKFGAGVILMGIVLSTIGNYAIASIEEDMVIIDSRKHSTAQFLSILNVIKEYYPDLSHDIVGNWICYAYQEINKKLPDISLYEVAVDIKEMVKEAHRGGNIVIGLNEIIASYIILKPKNY